MPQLKFFEDFLKIKLTNWIKNLKKSYSDAVKIPLKKKKIHSISRQEQYDVPYVM